MKKKREKRGYSEYKWSAEYSFPLLQFDRVYFLVEGGSLQPLKMQAHAQKLCDKYYSLILHLFFKSYTSSLPIENREQNQTKMERGGRSVKLKRKEKCLLLTKFTLYVRKLI